jgi:hypothetical protein
MLKAGMTPAEIQKAMAAGAAAKAKAAAQEKEALENGQAIAEHDNKMEV